MLAWRRQATTVMLSLAVPAAVPTIVASAVESWLFAAVTGSFMAACTFLAFRRDLDHRLRLAALATIGHGIALFGLGHAGLEGSGRLFLVGTPLVAFVLGGRRPGIFATIVSAAIFAFFTLLARGGWVPMGIPFPEGTKWLIQGAFLVLMSAPVGLLVERAISFQERTLERYRATSDALAAELIERRALEARLLEVEEIERQRIGQELHDGLCQQLTGAHLAARTLSRRLGNAPVPGQAPSSSDSVLIEDLAETILAALEDSRRLAHGLYAGPVPGDGLGAALRELAAEVRERVEVDCRFLGADRSDLSTTSATQLLRIAREASWNAAKHANASRITIELAGDEGTCRLTVRDDGRGFRPDTETGLGLRSMTDRSRGIGGTLTISDAPGGGTEVTCVVPLPPTRSTS